VKVESGEGGSAQPGKILLDQIRTVDKARLGKRVGQLPGDQIEEINRAIRLSLAV
jgi:mRNA-degrading endonuclease toxin of MazEF toxin-antitoxin module